MGRVVAVHVGGGTSIPVPGTRRRRAGLGHDREHSSRPAVVSRDRWLRPHRHQPRVPRALQPHLPHPPTSAGPPARRARRAGDIGALRQGQQDPSRHRRQREPLPRPGHRRWMRGTGSNAEAELRDQIPDSRPDREPPGGRQRPCRHHVARRRRAPAAQPSQPRDPLRGHRRVRHPPRVRQPRRTPGCCAAGETIQTTNDRATWNAMDAMADDLRARHRRDLDERRSSAATATAWARPTTRLGRCGWAPTLRDP